MSEQEIQEKVAGLVSSEPRRIHYTAEGKIEYEQPKRESSHLITDYMKIFEKDPEFAIEVTKLVEYLASTYGDKYAEAEIDTMNVAMGKILGKGFNIGNAAKYLGRYATEGYSKSNNPVDLQKAIHYCLFELKRVNKK